MRYQLSELMKSRYHRSTETSANNLAPFELCLLKCYLEKEKGKENARNEKKKGKGETDVRIAGV